MERFGVRITVPLPDAEQRRHILVAELKQRLPTYCIILAQFEDFKTRGITIPKGCSYMGPRYRQDTDREDISKRKRFRIHWVLDSRFEGRLRTRKNSATGLMRLRPCHVLDFLQHFIVFETKRGKTTKKGARYQQFVHLCIVNIR